MRWLLEFIKNAITVIFICFAIYGMGCALHSIEEVKEAPVELRLQQTDFLLSKTPTQKLVWEALIYYDIKNPEIVLAQAILETGCFKSRVCKEQNNLFGLWNSSKSNYYSYKHWSHSIKAYADSIQYKYDEEEDYYKFLDRIGYAEDPKYIEKVKEIREDLKIDRR